MTIVAVPRSIQPDYPHPSPLAAAWSGFVGFCVFVADVLHEARELEREAHERTPFIAW